MWSRIVLGGLVTAVVGGVVLGTSASAAPGATASYGPVVIPESPVQVCVADRCQTTPPVTSVSMSLSAAPQPGATGVPPAITSVGCASGNGVAAQVSGGSSGAVVTGDLVLGVRGGSSVTLPIRRTLAAGAQPVVVKACVGG